MYRVSCPIQAWKFHVARGTLGYPYAPHFALAAGPTAWGVCSPQEPAARRQRINCGWECIECGPALRSRVAQKPAGSIASTPNHPRPRRPINSTINQEGLPGTIPSASTLVHSTDELSLLIWNVDFAAPLVVRRFQRALSQLEKLVSPHLTSPLPPPTIILLQEVHTCFKTLLTNTFIREFAQITNLFSARSYSTLTLVPNSLASLVFSVSRVPFTETRMQRDCLVGGAESENIIANTHLESLNGFGDRARPKQLQAISRLLAASGVDAGLVAGDMNAISPSDRNLPEESVVPRTLTRRGSGKRRAHLGVSA
ncbi:hypothetical protein B0H14DRAFT_2593998 [Mycena olivaceomarginata]|nr:hypothetical protein B0H14DRAFT_2593998 [Mycena olivaceomarginata]